MPKIPQFLIVLLFVPLIFSCQKEENFEPAALRPNFSTDTLNFDTVFQTVGSATRYFMVSNSYDTPLQLDEISLARGKASPFRLNINGRSAVKVLDTKIPPEDSLFIFAEVTIDPAENAMLEKDSVVFHAYGKQHDVKLVAYGQDVHLINDSVVGTQTWTSDKPYLITNSMAVDENAVLTLEEGCQLHFSRDSRMLVLGSLNVSGTEENPVVFQGDRTESVYDDVPGQWVGIWLTKVSKNNYMQYAEVKNAHIGIQVDSVQNDDPMLTILNSKIQNHSLIGIYAQMSTIFAANLLIADCGSHALALTRGGAYNFYHTTVANYWNATVRTTPSVLLNNYFVHEGTAYLYDLNEAYFGNCIITGNNDDELGGDFYYEGTVVNYVFDHCMFDMTQESLLDPDDSQHFINPLINKKPRFKNSAEYDFSLDTLSPAIDAGSSEIVNHRPAVLGFDYFGQSRTNDAAPDLGAFERKIEQ